MPEYKEREEVLISLERYESMKEKVNEADNMLQRFFTVTEEKDGLSVLVHLDEIERWSKENHPKGNVINLHGNKGPMGSLDLRKPVKQVSYIGVKPDGTK